MTSIRKIASIVGVSPATVSRALRDLPSVDPDIKRRVQDVANLYRYRPNQLSHNLFSGKTRTLGCLLYHIAYPYATRVFRGILDQAQQEDYHVHILESCYQYLQCEQAIHRFVEQRVDGILLNGGVGSPIPRESIFALWSHGIPPVSVDHTWTSIPLDDVGTNELDLANMAIDYLLHLGHKRIAYISPISSLSLDPRKQAFVHAFIRRGLSTYYVWDNEEYMHKESMNMQERIDRGG